LREDDLFGYNGLRWNLKDLSLALRGSYQRRNAAVALAALETIQKNFPVSEASVRDGLKSVFWPARFEVVLTHPMVIVDGAHNIQGITVLAQETRNLLGGKKVRVLFGSMKDKDWAQMLQELCEIASEVSLTRVPMDRSEDPKVLRDAIPAGIPVNIVDDPVEAIRSLIKGAEANEAMLVTGSLYLLGRVRPFLVKMREAEILGAEA
jgi:dihydrofolate synthase/folylpolyglutamate synthase